MAQSGSNASSVASSRSARHGRDDAGRWNNSRSRGVRHLPYFELMDRKARGFCFRCGEKFHSLHQCAEKQLCLVILGNNETFNDAGEVIAIEIQEGEE